MTNYAVSLVRTWVTVMAGSLVSWLASFGFHVGDSTRRALMVWMTGLLIGAYYTAVRSLEQRYPKLGILLGVRQQPAYGPVVPAPAPVSIVSPPGPAPEIKATEDAPPLA